MKQKNTMLARMEAKIAAREHAKYQKQLDIALQMGMDAATIAANDVLGLEADKSAAFLTAYIDTYNTICKMITEDAKDDPDIEYSTAKIDQRIRQIVGDAVFKPWEERYE